MGKSGSTAGPSAPTVSASEAKSNFGAVLERAAMDGEVAITKHAKVKAVLLSVARYEALVAAQPDPLSALGGEFDRLLGSMAAGGARRAGRVLFDATPSELGRAAARRRGRG